MRNLISTTETATKMLEPLCILIYSRSIHGEPGGALRDFLAAHIPGSLYLDLDDELADRSDPKRGRHPLPTPEQFAEVLSRHGIGREHTIIVYDDSNGSQAARLWWMLRWIGCERVALLDGGLLQWQFENRPVESGLGRVLPPPQAAFAATCDSSMVATLEEVEQVAKCDTLLIDVRSAERFRGEAEHIDKRAGHIPDALNIPYSGNLEGMPLHFRAATELEAHYRSAGIVIGTPVICYCGSGVTACHTLLALELAGIARAKLFPGSWSEWIERYPQAVSGER
jgi:thiosulfate/3-mercaptopyruvate sulfurtransferase